MRITRQKIINKILIAIQKQEVDFYKLDIILKDDFFHVETNEKDDFSDLVSNFLENGEVSKEIGTNHKEIMIIDDCSIAQNIQLYEFNEKNNTGRVGFSVNVHLIY